MNPLSADRTRAPLIRCHNTGPVKIIRGSSSLLDRAPGSGVAFARPSAAGRGGAGALALGLSFRTVCDVSICTRGGRAIAATLCWCLGFQLIICLLRPTWRFADPYVT
ncbi:hypothetical protein KC361_g121 [Hortaea werneckii]|nr:hypothetical protein KC361_g121 [Hortaea werneckii]